MNNFIDVIKFRHFLLVTLEVALKNLYWAHSLQSLFNFMYKLSLAKEIFLIFVIAKLPI